jgi:hypothetical protein
VPRPDGDIAAGLAPTADDGDGVIGLEAAQSSRVRRRKPTDLGDHRFEHLGRRPAPRHERRHPPERRLLIGKARELFVRLAVRDRGRHQLGELRKTFLETLWERRIRRRRRNDSPDPAVNHDRSTGNAVEAVLTSCCGERARKIGVVLHPHGTTRTENLGGHRRAVERPPRARAKGVRTIAPDREDRHRRAVVVQATDSGIPEVHDLSDLLGNRCKHLCG